MDEFELERTRVHAADAAGAAGATSAADMHSSAASTSAMARRRRVGRGLIALCAVVVALAVVAGGPVWPALVSVVGGGAVQRPTGGTFLTVDVIHSVPWGTLFVDDAVLGQPYVVLTLEPGRHSVRYVATPFPELRCVLSVPLSAHDTCRVRPARPGVQGGGAPALDLEATFDRLPLKEVQALAGVVRVQLGALTSATTVEPGERYVAADGQIAAARERIPATLSYELNLDEHRADPFNTPRPDCPTFCLAEGQMDALNGRWQIYAHLLIRWHYSPPDGVPFYSFLTPANSQDAAMPVDVYWTGRWQAALGRNTPRGLCAIAGFLTEDLALPPGGSFSEDDALAPTAADGCLLTFTAVAEGTPPMVQRLRVLYRFGVLLAADAQTQRWLPTLPLATPAEQALARQIAE